MNADTSTPLDSSDDAGEAPESGPSPSDRIAMCQELINKALTKYKCAIVSNMDPQIGTITSEPYSVLLKMVPRIVAL